MQIGGFDVTDRVFIVAEIGNNHEGNFKVAQELVRRAAECGVDAVKFQTFKTEHYVSRSEDTRFRQLKSFELQYPQFEELAKLAWSMGLLFLSTPFDLESAEFLRKIVDAFKVASGDNNFYPLLDRIARSGKPAIVSSGVSDLDQVSRTVAFIRGRWTAYGVHGELALLHCVSGYPTPREQANLKSIPFLIQRFPEVTVGYSDHTAGLDAAPAAVALGARIVEKHFTLDKSLSDFRDHQLSADPGEMREVIRRVRETERMLGEFKKTVQPCEASNVHVVRRSIAAAAELPRGHLLRMSDLTWVRPAGGLLPGEEDRLVGRKLKREVHFGERITAADVDEG